MDRANLRLLEALPEEAPSGHGCDLSFISLRLVMPAVVRLIAPEGADLVALFKPQFELGRDAIGKGGIVRDVAAWSRRPRLRRAWLAPAFARAAKPPSPRRSGARRATWNGGRARLVHVAAPRGGAMTEQRSIGFLCTPASERLCRPRSPGAGTPGFTAWTALDDPEAAMASMARPHVRAVASAATAPSCMGRASRRLAASRSFGVNRGNWAPQRRGDCTRFPRPSRALPTVTSRRSSARSSRPKSATHERPSSPSTRSSSGRAT